VIVTNCHVVEAASKITVFTSDADPKQFNARVIGSDCLLEPYVFVKRWTTIGNNNRPFEGRCFPFWLRNFVATVSSGEFE